MERCAEVCHAYQPNSMLYVSWLMYNLCSSLAESLAIALPTLPPLASTSIVTGTGTSTFSASQGEDNSVGGPGSPWNDEEEKRFYTDLPDLRGEVPGALLKQNDESTSAGETGGNVEDQHIMSDPFNDPDGITVLDENV